MSDYLTAKSHYSFQQSLLSINDIIKEATKQNKSKVVLLDTNMIGAIEFYEKAKQHNLTPIIGLQAMMKIEKGKIPVTLIAKSQEDYKLLLKISSHNSIEGDFDYRYLRNRNTLEVVFHDYESNRNTLFFPNSPLSLDKMKQYIPHFHVGYHPQNPSIVSRYSRVNLTPMIAKPATDIATYNKLLLSQNAKKLIYNKSSEQYQNETNALLNTCNMKIYKEQLIPSMTNDNSSNQTLREKCVSALKKYRFHSQEQANIYQERLVKELKVIEKLNFADYFLIVEDYVSFAKQNDILVGLGRGSAAGSLVSYLLNITEVDPIEHNLLFERFLTETKASMPDIDVDFETERKHEVEEYIINKYGKKNVCKIGVVKDYGLKVAFDFAKKYENANVDLEKIQKFAKKHRTQSLPSLYQNNEDFRIEVNKTTYVKENLEMLDTIINTPRNVSVSGSSLIISKQGLDENVPLQLAATGQVVTQYDKNYIEKVGLLKMDVLSLGALSKIRKTVDLIETRTSQKFDLRYLDYNDKKTFDLLSKGLKFGIFQCESFGFKTTLTKVKPKNFQEFTDVISLYRPATRDNIDEYAKHEKTPSKVIINEFPELQSILQSTRGFILYQEQILEIMHSIGGIDYSLAESYRKQISKKKDLLDIRNKVTEAFEQHSNFSKDRSQELFDVILKNSDYSFNKSHAISYAKIAYQTAYLKANYIHDFLKVNITDKETIVDTKEELAQMGIQYDVPNINLSTSLIEINPLTNNAIIPLTCISGVTERAVNEIIADREQNGNYRSFYNFVERTNDMITDTEVFKLIDAGCFDSFDFNRTKLKNNYYDLKQIISTKQFHSIDETNYQLLNFDFNALQALENEKEMLGEYISSNPCKLAKKRFPNLQNLPKIHTFTPFNKEVVFVGKIDYVKEIVTKNNELMAIYTVSDGTKTINVTAFATNYKANPMKKNNICVFHCKSRVDQKYGLQYQLQEVHELVSKNNDTINQFITKKFTKQPIQNSKQKGEINNDY